MMLPAPALHDLSTGTFESQYDVRRISGTTHCPISVTILWSLLLSLSFSWGFAIRKPVSSLTFRFRNTRRVESKFFILWTFLSCLFFWITNTNSNVFLAAHLVYFVVDLCESCAKEDKTVALFEFIKVYCGYFLTMASFRLY